MNKNKKKEPEKELTRGELNQLCNYSHPACISNPCSCCPYRDKSK